MQHEQISDFAILIIPLALGATLLAGGSVSSKSYAQDTASENALEEIVVTARRREERLIDTPMSVNVFTGDQLTQQQVATIDEISHSIPGLVFDSTTNISGSSSSASVFIRGVGQTDFTLVTEPGVGIYVDDIYLTHSIGNVIEALDIERVEVLKGPQGTLFGRNTIGGALRVVTRKPHSKGFEGDIEVVLGKYDRLDVKGHVNVPVSEKLAVRFSALTQNWDGFVDRPRLKDATGGKDTGIFAVQARWQAERFTADLLFNTVRDRSTGAPNVLLAAGKGAGNQGAGVNADGMVLNVEDMVIDDSIAERLADRLGGDPKDYVWNSDRLPEGCSASNVRKCLIDNTNLRIDNDLDVSTAGLTLNWQFGDSVDLKSISSYRTLQSNFGRDGVHSFVPVVSVDSFIDVDSYSQEIQLTGSTNHLQWLAGLYYFKEDGFMDDDVRFNNFSLLSGGAVKTESASLFGQATWTAAESLDFTFGLRYTDESKTFTMDDKHQVLAGFGPSDRADAIWWLNPLNSPINTNYGFLLNFRNPTSGDRMVPSGCGNVENTITFKCELKEDSIDYHINLAWNPQEAEYIIYASYSTGFKGGGFQQRNANLAELPVFGAEEAQVLELGYKGDYLDGRMRLTAAYFNTQYKNFQGAVTEGDGQGVSVTRNAGDAAINGVEFDIRLAPGNFLLNFSLSVLDGKYDRLSEEAIRGGITTKHDLPRLPEIQTSASASYEFPFSGSSKLVPRLHWSYSSKMFNDVANSTELQRKPYNLINLSLSYEDESRGYAVSLFWKNITNEQFVTSGFYGTPSVGAPLEYVDGSVSRPSEWGVQVRQSF